MALASLDGLHPAVVSLTRVTWLAPAHVDGHINLGIVLIETLRFERAVVALRRALAVVPTEADIHHGIGVAAAGLGRSREAERSLRRALHLQPGRAETMVRLANVLIAIGQPGEAASLDRRALCLLPARGPAHFDLGIALARFGRNRRAIISSLRALAIEPRSSQALVNAAASLTLLGEIRHAIGYLKRAAFADGAGPEPLRNLMAVMSYDSAIGEEERRAIAQTFSDRHAAKTTVAAFAMSCDPERRLTVGYLSSDLYEHAVARALTPVVTAHDRDRFRIVGFSVGAHADGRTERLKRATDGWHQVEHLSDADIGERIRSESVDILIILGGRLDRNRPLVASHRAAPIQISMHDIGTSGLEAMDYLIADRVLVAPAVRRKEHFVERVLRLPSFYVHEPLVPPSTAASERHADGIVFGCFNNPAKISDATLDLWRRVLSAVPGSRLTLKYMRHYGDPDLRCRILGMGVDPARVTFLAIDDDASDHLRRYAEIDVALDTFPFTGSTTTWEALSMGVPVVTLLGETIVARTSASFLKPLGLEELIASDPDSYVLIVKSLVEDRDRLARLRASLYARIEKSPLLDGRGRARQLERIYRAVWRRWCASGRASAGPGAAGSGR